MQFLVYDKSIAGSDQDECTVAGNLQAIIDAAYEPVTDGKEIVAIRNDIDGAHIITDEVIDAVAKRYLKKFEPGDRVPAWLAATDAYDEWEGEYSLSAADIADIRADRFRDNRLEQI